MKKCILLFILIFFALLLGSYFVLPYLAQNEEPEVPLGLPPIPFPKDNPYSQKKSELGKWLYFDKRLSSDGTVSCATCHSIGKAFTDDRPVSLGIKERKGVRNSPTIINSAYQRLLFWDGRASSLEEQCKGPLGNPKEMTVDLDIHKAHRDCNERVKAIPGYAKLFKEAFGTKNTTIDEIAKAIATFERTILSGNSPYDRYVNGDKTALNENELQGFAVFKKAGCINCHNGPNFSDGRFHNLGVGIEEKNPDLGRYAITKNERDWGAFKTPILREVDKTAPYMHDGSLQTLEEVVEYYDKGGTPNKNLHPLIKPLHLSEKDKKALVSFMKALNGGSWQEIKEPLQFP